MHRDLKPGNMMLIGSSPGRRGGSSGPVAKLLDFGLAKAAAPAIASASLSMLPTTPPGKAALTEQGTILGTFQYMAPEQLDGRDADARTDIFVFGAVLYEMVTGRKAFEGTSHASLIGAIMHADPAPVSSLQPLAPRGLDRIVRKCLARDPDERWQSARDLLDELRWVAEPAEHGVAAAAATAIAPPAHAAGARRAWSVATISLLVALLALTAAVYVGVSTPETVVTRLDAMTPPTTDPFSFALSPDGRQLVFVANGENGPQLWLRPLDQATAQPLSGTEGAAFPFWAPDSRAVGFFADGKLQRVDFGLGAPRVLADAPLARGGTWSSDGVIVFGQASPGSLMRVTASGGIPSQITKPTPGQLSHRFPQFLPGGRRVLFFALSGDRKVGGIHVASLDGGEPVRVIDSETAAVYAPPGYLLRNVQGVLVAQRFDVDRATITGEPVPVAQEVGIDDGFQRSAFSVSASGVLAHRASAGSLRQLVWFDRAGKPVGAIGERDSSSYAGLELSPDGRRVAVSRVVQGNGDVWLIDTARAVANRFTFDASIDRAPIWSSTGDRVVFTSLRTGPAELFAKSATGAGAEQPAVTSPQAKAALDWSPDGSTLLYATQELKTQSDLWVVSTAGDGKPTPVVRSMFDDVQGQFSPDGRWLAYASNESGRYEIYVQPFPKADGKWQVSIDGGLYPRWRRDGLELYYVRADTRLMAVPIRLEVNARTIDAGTPVGLFSPRLGVGANIVTTAYASRAQYDVAADGRFLVNVQADDAAASPITIVLNWQSGLSAREKR